MPVEWEKASQTVLSTAEELIEKYHQDLVSAQIGFLFRSEASESRGRVTLGKAAKVPDKLRPLLDLDFIIWIAQDYWDRFTTEQRRALIDHELCHCAIEDGVLRMRGHDIEEFAVILDRYGLWKTDLFLMKEPLQKAVQLTLDQIEYEKDGGVVAVDPGNYPAGDLVEAGIV